MRFVAIMTILFLFFGLLFLAMKYILLKIENATINKKLKISGKQVEQVSLTKRDKSKLQKIFGKKISSISFLQNINHYFIFYKRNDVFLGGVNTEYDIIKIDIRKIRLNGQSILNMDVLAWSNREDYENKLKPTKEILEVLVKEETIKEQILLTLNHFFTNKNTINNEITINND